MNIQAETIDKAITRERYLDPTNDVAFKKVFMDEERLRGFLNAIMKLPEGSQIVELEFLPQEVVPQVGEGKRGMFDIKCKNEKGKIFIIEMQNDIKAPFLQRVEFYGSHTYVSQIDSGISHAELMPVIVIVVVKDKLFPDEVECINWHEMREIKTNGNFLRALFYGFIELGKFKKRQDELKTPEDYWLDFLANSPYEVAPPSALNDPCVKKAYEVLERFNWNKVSYDAYLRSRLLKEHEEFQEIKSRAEGMVRGEAKAKLEIARNLLKNNVDIKTIIDATGLDEETIRTLS